MFQKLPDGWVSLGTFQEGPGGSLIQSLKKAGIDGKKVYNPNTCRTGCATTYEVWADGGDRERLMEVLTANYVKGLPSEKNMVTPTDSTYNPDLPEATCPACSTVFSTQLTECPECGLRIA
ncbi:MAG: hypothetical protein HRU19_12895 [Pseudobacteriovorax sp.]|nr:hypothetical protein [Pseudobacteriovorax sp.]